MQTSPVVQDPTDVPPPALGNAKNRRQSVRLDQLIDFTDHADKLVWAPQTVLAQPPAADDPSDSQSLFSRAANAMLECADKFKLEGDEAWDSLMHALLQSDILQPFGTQIDHADMLVRKTASFALNGGSHARALKEEIDKWLHGLVHADPTLFDHTEYTMNALVAQILQESTSALHSGNMHKTKVRHEGKIDVPVFRLPDPERPFLTVYRIRVDVWCSKQRAFVVRQSDELVLSGQYNVRYFRLRGESTS